MGLVFVPLYIKYLGIEAYGLIGIFALLQAWLTLLDMGLTPTLAREMARFTGGAHNEQSIRDLLRSIEIIALGVACLMAVGIWRSSTWLASDWLRAEKLPVSVVAQAFSIMGIVTALRFLEGIYRSSMVGLQRQVHLNAINSAMATLRGLGAVGVLAWISPSITAFFVWQGLISLLTLLIFARATYSAVPSGKRTGRFSVTALKGVWRFSGGMLGITLLSLLFSQVDKILLSRMLVLSDYGYYTLASALAGVIFMLTSPVTQAFFPRLSELHARRDETQLIQTFHKSAQLVTVMMGSAAFVLIAFSGTILYLWTHNTELARHSAVLLSVLCLGNMLNGLMWVLFSTQSAYGWTGLTVRISSISVAIIVPAILWVTPRYGAVGAAWVYVILNAGNVLFGAQFMFRRILTSEKLRWYVKDVILPLLGAGSVAFVLARFMPGQMVRGAQFAWLVVAGALTLTAGVLMAQTLRESFLAYLLVFLRNFSCKIEKVDRAYIAYSPKHTIFIREYYFYCINLFRRSFSGLDSPVNVIFGDYDVRFPNAQGIVKIDIQWEHTLVKPGGRDSGEAVRGKITLGDSADFYLVRIQNYNYLKNLDLVVEYSIPNMINVRECGAFDDYLSKNVYIAPLLYDIDFESEKRDYDIVTLFFDIHQPRRKFFLDRARKAGLPLKNVRGLFGKNKLKQLYKRTKILVNIHQTDHHDTFEELRILPALLCGVIIVSEDVPLKEHIPYNKFIIWSSHENMMDTVKSVYDNYEYYYKKIFSDPELVNTLMEMKKNNSENVDRAVHEMLLGGRCPGKELP